MIVTAHIINAFTDNGRGGNPAAVILDRPDLKPEQRQEIARKIGASETVFLDKFEQADFYTPTRPIANCGHATIAAFSLVDEFTGRSFGGFDMVTSHNPKSRQSINIDGNKVFLDIPVPKSADWQNHEIEIQDEIFEALALKKKHRVSSLPIYRAGFGNQFILVPLQSRDSLSAIKPNHTALKRLSEKFNVIGFYPFTLDAKSSAHDAQARMFAPAYGIDEESATGMAGAALAYYLSRIRGLNQDKILIEQGHHMAKLSPSLLEARINKNWFGKVKSIQIGGETKKISELELAI